MRFCSDIFLRSRPSSTMVTQDDPSNELSLALVGIYCGLQVVELSAMTHAALSGCERSRDIVRYTGEFSISAIGADQANPGQRARSSPLTLTCASVQCGHSPGAPDRLFWPHGPRRYCSRDLLAGSTCKGPVSSLCLICLFLGLV